MKNHVFIIILFICSHSLFGQNNNSYSHNVFSEFTEVSENGELNIEQDSSITNLLNKAVAIDSKTKGIPQGYRIQIFSASGINARDEMNQVKKQFMQLYPDFNYNQIYSVYHAPFFKVRIGNYRDKFEALKFYKEVSRKFPNAYMVKGFVEFPSLDN